MQYDPDKIKSHVTVEMVTASFFARILQQSCVLAFFSLHLLL